MPLVEQLYHVCKELSIGIVMKRERKVRSAQTEKCVHGHGHELICEDGQIFIGRARFQC